MPRLASVAQPSCVTQLKMRLAGGQRVSSPWRAQHRRFEPGNDLLGALAKDDVFAGRTHLQLLEPSLGALEVSSGFHPLKIHGIYSFHNVKGGHQGGTSLQRIGQTERAGLETFSESSSPSCAIRVPTTGTSWYASSIHCFER